jgi:hypothetical protein
MSTLALKDALMLANSWGGGISCQWWRLSHDLTPGESGRRDPTAAGEPVDLALAALSC